MKFENAMKFLRHGDKVKRIEWPEGQFIFLNQGYPVGKHLYPSQPNTPVNIDYGSLIKNPDAGVEGQMMNHLIMSPRKESGYWGKGKLDYVPYAPSNFDLFCEDWVEFIPDQTEIESESEIECDNTEEYIKESKLAKEVSNKRIVYILTDRGTSGEIIVTFDSEYVKEIENSGNYLVQGGEYREK